MPIDEQKWEIILDGLDFTDEEQEASEKAIDIDGKIRDAAFERIDEIEGYDFVERLGTNYKELL